MRGKGAYFAPDYFERLGDQLLGPTGKLIGEGVQGALKAFGLGQYDLQENSLLQKVRLDPGDSVPRIENVQKGEGFVIQHEEYVGDLFTGGGTPPTGFTIETFNLNPANEELFPWLSTVAVNFEEWKPLGMIFTLKTMASDVSTALSLGTMFGAIQYDSLDTIFTTKEELLNYEGANSVKVSHSTMIPVECKPSLDTLTHLYVKPGNILPTGADTRFYDLGNASFGSTGCPTANVPIAELWVSYEIAFYKPKLTAGGDLHLLWESARWNVTTGFSTTAYCGTNPLFMNGVETAFSLVSTGGLGLINFPADADSGTYLLVLQVLGSAATTTVPTTTNAINCSIRSVWQNNAVSIKGTPQNGLAGVTNYSLCMIVNITGENSRVEIGGGTMPTSSSSAEWFITQINGLCGG